MKGTASNHDAAGIPLCNQEKVVSADNFPHTFF